MVIQAILHIDKIVEAAKASTGHDLSSVELINIDQFVERVMELSDYRRELYDYLTTKMDCDISKLLKMLLVLLWFSMI